MKIVHVCLSGPFYEGYAYQDNILPKYHKKLGNDVAIIAPTFSKYDNGTGNIEEEKVGKYFLEDGITLIRIPAVFPYKIHLHFHFYRHLGATIESLNPDLIFVHSVACLNYRFFARYHKNHPDVRIVFDNHADFENSCHNKLSYWYSRFIIRHLVVKKVKDATSKFYGVTPARCDFLHEVYGAPQSMISLLPMGADDEEMRFEQKDLIRHDIRKQYGFADDDFLIVTGGKIDSVKNIHVLAEAVAKTEYKKIKILIFGSILDEMKPIFDKLVSDRVKCIGWVPSNEVYRYFYTADIVIFPGLHSVMWEQAVASQVPLAVSRIKGFEHVDFNGNCVLMDRKDVAYYQGLIERLFTDKAWYKDLYNNAHSNESSMFLYSKIAQKVIDDVSI